MPSRHPHIAKDVEALAKSCDKIAEWLVEAAERMQNMLDRVENPGDYAPDLQRAFDLAAVQELKATLASVDEMQDKVRDVAIDLPVLVEEAMDAAYADGVADHMNGEVKS